VDNMHPGGNRPRSGLTAKPGVAQRTPGRKSTEYLGNTVACATPSGLVWWFACDPGLCCWTTSQSHFLSAWDHHEKRTRYPGQRRQACTVRAEGNCTDDVFVSGENGLRPSAGRFPKAYRVIRVIAPRNQSRPVRAEPQRRQYFLLHIVSLIVVQQKACCMRIGTGW
jgi:hypothetical protein